MISSTLSGLLDQQFSRLLAPKHASNVNANLAERTYSQAGSITHQQRSASMSERKFKVGQAVEYHPPRGLYAPAGEYHVTAKLPMRYGEFEYCIKLL